MPIPEAYQRNEGEGRRRRPLERLVGEERLVCELREVARACCLRVGMRTKDASEPGQAHLLRSPESKRSQKRILYSSLLLLLLLLHLPPALDLFLALIALLPPLPSSAHLLS